MILQGKLTVSLLEFTFRGRGINTQDVVVFSFTGHDDVMKIKRGE
jgi:hypothetical protein